MEMSKKGLGMFELRERNRPIGNKGGSYISGKSFAAVKTRQEVGGGRGSQGNLYSVWRKG